MSKLKVCPAYTKQWLRRDATGW